MEKIVIYGAATMGIIYKKKFADSNISVISFIDKRADEIGTLQGVPVVSIEASGEYINNIVFVSVKNVYEHSSIAKSLRNIGFSRIIYRPYDVLMGNGTPEQKKLNEIYSLIEKGAWGFDDEVIPVIDENDAELQDDALIVEEGDDVLAYLPITILFTDAKRKDNKKSEGINILTLYSHVKFAAFALGKPNGDIKPYMDFCVTAANSIGDVRCTDEWKKNIIRNRTEVFTQMDRMFNLRPDFFYDNAPFVTWNSSRKYFNLHSGKHRAIYLLAKGLTYIPVKMKKSDYLIWKNDHYINEISNNLRDVRCPIENPYLFSVTSSDHQNSYRLLQSIINEMCRENYDANDEDYFEKLKIIVNVDDDGFIKRFFLRCGCRVYSKNKSSNEQIINNILYMSDCNEVSEDSFDYAIVSDDDDAMQFGATTIFILARNEGGVDKKGLLFDSVINGERICLIKYEYHL